MEEEKCIIFRCFCEAKPSNGRKTKPNQKSKIKWIVTGIRYIEVYCLFSLLIVIIKVSSLFPVFQGLACECCRFYRLIGSLSNDDGTATATRTAKTAIGFVHFFAVVARLQRKSV